MINWLKEVIYNGIFQQLEDCREDLKINKNYIKYLEHQIKILKKEKLKEITCEEVKKCNELRSNIKQFENFNGF